MRVPRFIASMASTRALMQKYINKNSCLLVFEKKGGGGYNMATTKKTTTKKGNGGAGGRPKAITESVLRKL